MQQNALHMMQMHMMHMMHLGLPLPVDAIFTFYAIKIK